MSKRRKQTLPLDAPLTDLGHGRPMTRRDLIAQGFRAGVGAAMMPALAAGLASRGARAQHLNPTYAAEWLDRCRLGASNAPRIPFICFDLAGGAMLDIGIYPITFARFLAGDPVEVKVSGTLGATGVDANVGGVVGFATGDPPKPLHD